MKKSARFLLAFITGVVCLTSTITIGKRAMARNASASLPADARSNYAAQCVTCHGRDGRGRTAKGRRTHARDLTNPEWQNDVSDERLFNSINNGRGKMPAFKKSLSESQIDELVSYVRGLRRR